MRLDQTEPTNRPSAGANVPVSPTTKAFDDLDFALDSLREAINVVDTLLTPVMSRVENETTQRDDAEKAVMGASPLVEALERKTEIIRDFTRKINKISQRIEL